jgi:hypothetical protein
MTVPPNALHLTHHVTVMATPTSTEPPGCSFQIARHVTKASQQKEIEMKSQTLGLRVAGTIFAVVCLGHVLRVVTRVDLIIAGYHVPFWMNLVGALIAGAMSLWMWKLSAERTPG